MTHPVQTDALEERVAALEDRVAALTEAVRVLAHGLEDLPWAEPRENRAATATAARRAYDLLLAAGPAVTRPARPPGET
jgi:hypothetical protein